jgi:AAA ATPase domain/Protein of unknown function (DUF3696)
VHGLPLQTQGFVFGSSLLDLVYGRLPGSTFELGVELSGDLLDYKIQTLIGPEHSDLRIATGRSSQRIWAWAQTHTIKQVPNSTFSAKLTWDRQPGDGYFGLQKDNQAQTLRFNGIIPSELDDLFLEAAAQHPVSRDLWLRFLRQHPLSSFYTPPHVAHLGPFRNEFPRFHRVADRLSTHLGTRGQYAGEVLGLFHRLGQREVIERIKSWFYDYLDLELDVQQMGIEESELATVVRARPKGRSAWVNLADVGTGSAHVLPFVVQQAISIASSPEVELPDLLVCEEPEAHLHPSAQAGLGELAIETALAGRSRVILETHSETLLLRIRRRIAEQKLSPDQVAMYWVDDEGGSTELKRLHVKEDGWVEDWPEGIFAEAASEARGISKANRERKGL